MTSLQSSQDSDDDYELDEKDLAEFDHNFSEWEKQFSLWKEQNKNHPNKAALKSYEDAQLKIKNDLLSKRNEIIKQIEEKKKSQQNKSQINNFSDQYLPRNDIPKGYTNNDEYYGRTERPRVPSKHTDEYYQKTKRRRITVHEQSHYDQENTGARSEYYHYSNTDHGTPNGYHPKPGLESHGHTQDYMKFHQRSDSYTLSNDSGISSNDSIGQEAPQNCSNESVQKDNTNLPKSDVDQETNKTDYQKKMDLCKMISHIKNDCQNHSDLSQTNSQTKSDSQKNTDRQTKSECQTKSDCLKNTDSQTKSDCQKDRDSQTKSNDQKGMDCQEKSDDQNMKDCTNTDLETKPDLLEKNDKGLVKSKRARTVALLPTLSGIKELLQKKKMDEIKSDNDNAVDAHQDELPGTENCIPGRDNDPGNFSGYNPGNKHTGGSFPGYNPDRRYNPGNYPGRDGVPCNYYPGGNGSMGYYHSDYNNHNRNNYYNDYNQYHQDYIPGRQAHEQSSTDYGNRSHTLPGMNNPGGMRSLPSDLLMCGVIPPPPPPAEPGVPPNEVQDAPLVFATDKLISNVREERRLKSPNVPHHTTQGVPQRPIQGEPLYRTSSVPRDTVPHRNSSVSPYTKSTQGTNSVSHGSPVPHHTSSAPLHGSPALQRNPPALQHTSSAPRCSSPEVTDIGETSSVEEILLPPGRFMRAPKILIIIRAMPNTGGIAVAKLIKEREIENGGTSPTVLLLDEYFGIETEKLIPDSRTGRLRKEKAVEYEFNVSYEIQFRSNLANRFREVIRDDMNDFVILVAVNNLHKHFVPLAEFAIKSDYEVFITSLTKENSKFCNLELVKRPKKEINYIKADWQKTPAKYNSLDLDSLIEELLEQTVIPLCEEDNTKREENDTRIHDNDSCSRVSDSRSRDSDSLPRDDSSRPDSESRYRYNDSWSYERPPRTRGDSWSREHDSNYRAKHSRTRDSDLWTPKHFSRSPRRDSRTPRGANVNLYDDLDTNPLHKISLRDLVENHESESKNSVNEIRNLTDDIMFNKKQKIDEEDITTKHKAKNDCDTSDLYDIIGKRMNEDKSLKNIPDKSLNLVNTIKDLKNESVDVTDTKLNLYDTMKELMNISKYEDVHDTTLDLGNSIKKRDIDIDNDKNISYNNDIKQETYLNVSKSPNSKDISSENSVNTDKSFKYKVASPKNSGKSSESIKPNKETYGETVKQNSSANKGDDNRKKIHISISNKTKKHSRQSDPEFLKLSQGEKLKTDSINEELHVYNENEKRNEELHVYSENEKRNVNKILLEDQKSYFDFMAELDNDLGMEFKRDSEGNNCKSRSGGKKHEIIPGINDSNINKNIDIKSTDNETIDDKSTYNKATENLDHTTKTIDTTEDPDSDDGIEVIGVTKEERHSNKRRTLTRPCKVTKPHYDLSEDFTKPITDGEWLNDTHIDEAQALLHKQFPAIGGFQPVGVFQPGSEGAMVGTPNRCFIQILNTGRHWICLSTVNAPDGVVEVYDSLGRGRYLDKDVLKGIAWMIYHSGDSVAIDYCSIQKQRHHSDCGLYAIAVATVLSHGLNPRNYTWDQDAMRPHLVQCFMNRHMSLFPVSRIRPPNEICSKPSQQVVKLMCICRQPLEFSCENSAQCENCLRWFHQICCSIEPSVFEEKTPWVCDNCLQTNS